jgi:hypothetical protein
LILLKVVSLLQGCISIISEGLGLDSCIDDFFSGINLSLQIGELIFLWLKLIIDEVIVSFLGLSDSLLSLIGGLIAMITLGLIQSNLQFGGLLIQPINCFLDLFLLLSLTVNCTELLVVCFILSLCCFIFKLGHVI